MSRCCSVRAKPAFCNVFDQFHSTCKRQSGILMNVHSAELLRELAGVVTTSLPDSVRMNRNNLLELHS